MTKADIQRRFSNGTGDQFGIAGYCAICGCNLMCAPLKHVLENIHSSWNHCFAECRGCGTKNPPVNVHTFTEDDWHNGNWNKRK